MRWLLFLLLLVAWTPTAFAFELNPLESQSGPRDATLYASQEFAGSVADLTVVPPRAEAGQEVAARYAGCEQSGYSMRTTSMGAALIVLFALFRRRRTKAQLSSGRPYTSQR
jgi:hypothetical protein